MDETMILFAGLLGAGATALLSTAWSVLQDFRNRKRMEAAINRAVERENADSERGDRKISLEGLSTEEAEIILSQIQKIEERLLEDLGRKGGPERRTTSAQ